MEFDKQREREQTLGGMALDDLIQTPEMEDYIGNMVMKQVKEVMKKKDKENEK